MCVSFVARAQGTLCRDCRLRQTLAHTSHLLPTTNYAHAPPSRACISLVACVECHLPEQEQAQAKARRRATPHAGVSLACPADTACEDAHQEIEQLKVKLQRAETDVHNWKSIAEEEMRAHVGAVDEKRALFAELQGVHEHAKNMESGACEIVKGCAMCVHSCPRRVYLWMRALVQYQHALSSCLG